MDFDGFDGFDPEFNPDFFCQAGLGLEEFEASLEKEFREIENAKNTSVHEQDDFLSAKHEIDTCLNFLLLKRYQMEYEAHRQVHRGLPVFKRRSKKDWRKAG